MTKRRLAWLIVAGMWLAVAFCATAGCTSAEKLDDWEAKVRSIDGDVAELRAQIERLTVLLADLRVRNERAAAFVAAAIESLRRYIERVENDD